MKLLSNFWGGGAFLVFLMILQDHRLLSFAGINPNLLLLGILPLGFLNKKNLWPTVGLFLVILGLSFFWWPFWRLKILLLLLLVFLVYFLKKFLTGHPWLDFLIAVLVITVLFYLLGGFLTGNQLSWDLIFGEAAYNLILAPLFWWLAQNLFYEKIRA